MADAFLWSLLMSQGWRKVGSILPGQSADAPTVVSRVFGNRSAPRICRGVEVRNDGGVVPTDLDMGKL